MDVEFKMIDNWSNIDAYYVQDMDRVQSDTGSNLGLRSKTFTAVAVGGINLDLALIPAVTYTPAPIERTTISRDKNLSVGRINLTVGDRALTVANAISKDPQLLVGARVILRRVYTSLPYGEVSSYRQIFDGQITQFKMDADRNLNLEVSDRWFDWGATLNKRNYTKHCGFRFKGDRCGYAGLETFCDKSLVRCQELNNDANFGGYPETVDVKFTGVPFS